MGRHVIQRLLSLSLLQVSELGNPSTAFEWATPFEAVGRDCPPVQYGGSSDFKIDRWWPGPPAFTRTASPGGLVRKQVGLSG